jgi:hypothetical protein
MRRIALLLGVLIALGAPATRALAATNGSARLAYKVAPILTMTVTPNYQSGFGPIGGYGSGITPAAGSLATLGGGTVDFGSNVVAGYQYLYRYAAQVSVTTNDQNGFAVYGEGSSDWNGSTSFPLANTLYWLVSNSTNSPYSPASAFNRTAATPTGGGTGINYGAGNPPAAALVWQTVSGGTQTEGFDYQLRIPGNVPLNQLNVYIVYTAVAS